MQKTSTPIIMLLNLQNKLLIFSDYGKECVHFPCKYYGENIFIVNHMLPVTFSFADLAPITYDEILKVLSSK